MDTQSIINCLEALRDKLTPEQIAKLEQLKKDWGKASTQEAINQQEVGNEDTSSR